MARSASMGVPDRIRMRPSTRLFADRWKLLRLLPVYRRAPLRSVLRALDFTLREIVLGDRARFTACEGCSFVTPPRNISSFIAALSGQRDPHVVAFWRKHLRHGSTFFDVGANIGLYAVPASRRVGVSGLTVAFEAHPYIFKFLQANMTRNGASPMLAENLAVGEASKSTRIAYNAENPGQTRIAIGAEVAEPVAMVTLDDYCQRQRIRAVDYLKIDVEGYEINVLRGARDIIARSPEILIQTEYERAHRAVYVHAGELPELLQGWGFRPHCLAPDGTPAALDGLDDFSGEIVWSRSPLA